MKAMILAAGFGKRMLPLSSQQPKPLLQAGGRSLIEHNLYALQQAGIEEVIINVHHHADQIMATLGDGSRFGINICYSHEKSQLLGTGGGIANALPLLGDQPFLLLSGDIWTDFPLHTLLSQPVSHAHLIMVNNPAFHPQGDYTLNNQGLVSKQQSATLTYASMGVFHPKLFTPQPQASFTLTTVLEPAIEQNKITGQHYTGQWWNVGTPQILKQLNEVLAES